MPAYTLINNIPYPIGSDPPNVETATHPVVKAVERRAFSLVQNEVILPDAIPDPSEGMSHYNEDHDESMIFTDGKWKALSPRWQFLPSTVTITGTSNVTVMTFDLQPASIYRLEGTFIFFSEDDSILWSMSAPTGSYWRLRNIIGSASSASTYTPEPFNQGVSFHGVTIRTPVGSDTELLLRARKDADTGADCEVTEGFAMLQRFTAWSGV